MNQTHYELKYRVWQANQLLPQHQLSVFTWGNASEILRSEGLVAIKPSGISYEELNPEDMVLVDLNGQIVEGKWKPSSDLPTHLCLYRAFTTVGGVVHTHSRWATSFAQAGRGIPAMGTTQGDYFYGEIPCTRSLTPQEVAGAYEAETGNVIIETFQGKDPMAIPGVLVYGHGPFSWGTSAMDAVHNSVVMEEAAFMDYHTLMLNPDAGPIPSYLLQKHYLRKHGKGAYYGQTDSNVVAQD